MAIHPGQINLGAIAVQSEWDCPASVAVGDPVYQNGSSMELADCSDPNKMPCRGIVISKPSSTRCVVLTAGRVYKASWGLVSGRTYFVGAGVGVDLEENLPSATGTFVQGIGYAVDSEHLEVLIGTEFDVKGESILDEEYYVGTGGVVLRDAVTLESADTVKKRTASTAVLGFVIELLTGGRCLIRREGPVPGFAGLLVGSIYYGDNTTPGAITATPPTGPPGAFAQEVGVARNSTTLVAIMDQDYVVL